MQLKTINEKLAEYRYKGKYSGERTSRKVSGDLMAAFFLEEDVRELITQDRADIRAVLREGVKPRPTSYCGYAFKSTTIDTKVAVDCINGAEKMGYNQAIKDFQKLIDTLLPGEQACEHQYGDLALLSNPPQYKCIKCGHLTRLPGDVSK